METSALESRIASLKILPAMPEVLRRLNEIAKNPNSSADDFAKCVSYDPALASKVLRTANSAVFCPSGGQTRTLRHAVVVLGIRTLRGLILAFSIHGGFGSRRGPEVVERSALWGHCMAAGVGAKIIATLTKAADPNEAFVAGLLHDVGILALLGAEPETLSRALMLAQGGSSTLIEAEREIGKHTHEDWGMAAARYWGLPDIVARAAGYHHRPWEDRETGPTTACVHLSDCLASGNGRIVSPTIKPDQVAPEVLKSLDMPEAQLVEIAKVMVKETAKAQETFGLALAA